jgi:hypothetical protein
MKSLINITKITLFGAALFAVATVSSGLAQGTGGGISQVVPPDPSATPYGKTYAQWAGEWWKWFMQLPLTNGSGVVHPGINAGQAAFDVTEGQTSPVWFLAMPSGKTERSATIPQGTALFFALLDAEDFEPGRSWLRQ